jgi:hypothetical protein
LATEYPTASVSPSNEEAAANQLGSSLPYKAQPFEITVSEITVSDVESIKKLETGLHDTNNRLSRLENCCGMLAESTKNLESQLTQLTTSVGSKLHDMTIAINKVNSPNNRNKKAQKSSDNQIMDLDFE